MGDLDAMTGRASRRLKAMEKDLEACLGYYRQGEWAGAQHRARMCAEAIALSSLELLAGWRPPKPKRRDPTLDDYVQELQRHRRIDVPLQRAFQLVQATGNQGSHIQSRPEAEPNHRGAELCTSNLVVIVEWFLEATGTSSDRATRVVAELRQRFATSGSYLRPVSDLARPIVSGDDADTIPEPFARKSPMPRIFADWYQDVRPELRQLLGDRVDALEQREGWLQADGRATPALHVCVVGQAAVGKSTLINCLVSDQLSILPSGGVGPHTASAIVVRYATDPHAEIRFVNLDRVHELRRALTKREPTTDDLAAARILVEGNQFGTLAPAELAVRIERLLDPSEPPTAAHELRVWSALAAIRAGNQTVRQMAGEDLPAFSEGLEQHASGLLAPLTEAVEVGWDTDMLAPGLCLVDLPGFGVASDKHKAVSQRELARARAVLWAVDRSGLTEGTLQELRRIELFRRVASGEPDAPVLTIAVTRLDETAGDARKRSSTKPRPTFDEALATVSRAAEDMIQAQLREALAHLEPAERDRVYERVAIHPVAPVEHRRIYLQDEEEPPRVTAPDLTGIPRLRRHLRSLAAKRRAHAATEIDRLLEVARASNQAPLARRLLGELRVVTPDKSPQP